MKISNDESLRASRIKSVSPVPSGAVKTSPATTPGSGPAAQVELSAQAKALSASKTVSKAEAARFLPVQAAPETRDDLVSRSRLRWRAAAIMFRRRTLQSRSFAARMRTASSRPENRTSVRLSKSRKKRGSTGSRAFLRLILRTGRRLAHNGE